MLLFNPKILVSLVSVPFPIDNVNPIGLWEETLAIPQSSLIYLFSATEHAKWGWKFSRQKKTQKILELTSLPESKSSDPSPVFRILPPSPVEGGGATPLRLETMRRRA